MIIYEVIVTLKFLIFIWILLMYLLYLIGDKEHSITFKEKYHDHPLHGYSPVEMKQLINYGRLYSKDAIAQFIDLIIRDVLILEKNEEFYKINLNKNFNFNSLNEHDKYLLEWLVEYLGSTSGLNISKIVKMKFSFSNILYFKIMFNKWVKLVNSSKKTKRIFYPRKKGITFGAAISLLYLIVGVFLTIYIKRYTYLFLILLAVITFIYSLNIIKRRPQAQLQYELCMAFKRYLKDLGKNNIDLSVSTCESYMPFAVCLGVSSQLIEYINSKENRESDNPELRIFNKISPKEFENLLNDIIDLMEKTIHAHSSNRKTFQEK